MRHRHKRSATVSSSMEDFTESEKNQDLDELFILKKCAGYLLRINPHTKMFSEESISVLYMVLGRRIEILNDFIPDFLNKKQREQFREDMEEWTVNIEFYPTKMARTIARLHAESRLSVELAVFGLLTDRHAELSDIAMSGLEKRLNQLGKALGLNDLEKEFILFSMIIHTVDPCENLFWRELDIEKFHNRKYLKKILNTDTKGLSRVLTGTLAKIGIVSVNASGMIDVNNDIFGFLLNPQSQNLFEDQYRRINVKETIPIEFHMIERPQTDFLLKLLKKPRRSSTHILLYGTPGTGKTSFTYGIARELGIPAYEIIRNEANTTIKRRAAIVACMNRHQHGEGSLIIVDEADNILNTQDAWLDRGETQDKGWLNDLLEKAGYRFIWITNRIRGIEDSVMRRFSYSIHFKPFDRKQRIHIWNNILEKNRVKGITDKDIETFANNYPVSAGAVEIAVRKAKEAFRTHQKEFRNAIQMSLDAHLTLLKGGIKPSFKKDQIEENYTLEGLNIEGDIKTMMTQVKSFDRYLRQQETDRSANMNLLFYGPPGTGKSELARYIAHDLQRELICRRASDVINPFVGMTEQNIAATFQESESQGAVLVIDEVDTFLFSRDRAQQSWEISFTNEFLTQMERYRGILICTTNRLEGLDTAAIRRFNQKIGFRYLAPEGNILFYEMLLNPLHDTSMDLQDRGTLFRIDGLAPGDFRVVRDRFSFYPKEEITHSILIQALQEEVATRNKQQRLDRKIGF